MARNAKSSEEDRFWELHSPQTAQVAFNKSKARGTPDYSKSIAKAEDLYKFIENYPKTPASMSINQAPELISYYFPKLKISEEELEIAQKLVRMQVFTDIMNRCRDTGILDRLNSTIHSNVNITFNVLPKAEPCK